MTAAALIKPAMPPAKLICMQKKLIWIPAEQAALENSRSACWMQINPANFIVRIIKIQTNKKAPLKGAFLFACRSKL